MREIIKLTAVISVTFLCYTGAAQAQWVLIGRKAVGVINRLASQGHEKQGQGFDVATVLLEADADKVYSTAIDLAKANPNITITYKEDSSREIEVTDGKILAGIKVSKLEDKLSQLLISSTSTPGQPSSTSFVVEKVLEICEKIGVHCAVSKD